MISTHLIYLATLSKEEKISQIFMTLLFFLILIAISGLFNFLKLKFMDKNKKSLFQSFLKRIWFYKNPILDYLSRIGFYLYKTF